MLAKIVLVALVFASPVTAQPPLVSEETHRSDLQLMREWSRSEMPVPDEGTISRMAAWINEHPDDAESLYLLSYALGAGLTSPDVEGLDPVQLLKRAAAGGHPQAVSLLGFRMVRGDGVPPDPEGGLGLVRAAMDQGVVEAKYHLGSLHLLGEGGMEQDPERAKALLSEAAEDGLVRAWMALSVAHLFIGNCDAAREAMRKGAEGGDPQAQWNLGQSYLERSVFGRHNPSEAFRWIKAACEHPAARPDWWRQLAYMYEGGTGTAVDDEMAERYFRVAADAGDVPAMLWLAGEHLSGFLSDADPAKGLAMLEELARQEVAAASSFLGEVYLQGLWLERDLHRALHYYQLAAEQGDESAQILIADIDRALERGFR